MKTTLCVEPAERVSGEARVQSKEANGLCLSEKRTDENKEESCNELDRTGDRNAFGVDGQEERGGQE
jgi:hypothetical protein